MLLIWILPYSAFTQTDTTYCLPIKKARLLVADAYQNRIQDSLISELSGKIRLLEQEKQTLQININNIILNERAKTNTANLLSQNYKRLSDTNEQESTYYKKQLKKSRRKLTAAVILGVLLVGIAVTN